MSPDFSFGEACDIFVGDLSDRFPAWLSKRSYSKILILTDDNCAKHCLPLFLQKSGLPADTPLIVIAPGESEKNIQSCSAVWHQLLEQQADRKALLINLGGGVIGDLGGFCAATWKRGIDFIQVPTTLLSMTDASIGGKTGIDFEGIKNSIGVFQQPRAVFADPDFLATLSVREQRSGLAEVIKHALIGDLDLIQEIGQPGTKTLLRTETLKRSIAVKVRVVSEDPLESGLRMLLNYGHSIGHAIESRFMDTSAPLTHGEAIAIGMVLESWAAKAINYAAVQQICARWFSPVPIPQQDWPQLWELLQQDKKNQSGTVFMVLPGDLPYQMKKTALDASTLNAALEWWNRTVCMAD